MAFYRFISTARNLSGVPDLKYYETHITRVQRNTRTSETYVKIYFKDFESPVEFYTEEFINSMLNDVGFDIPYRFIGKKVEAVLQPKNGLVKRTTQPVGFVIEI